MKLCPYCGSQCADENVYCQNCGNSIADIAPSAPANSQTPTVDPAPQDPNAASASQPLYAAQPPQFDQSSYYAFPAVPGQGYQEPDYYRMPMQQPYGMQPPYYYQPPVPPASNSGRGLGIAGMILGILSILLFFIPIFDVVMAFTGLCLSIPGLVMAKKANAPLGFALAGLICSVAGLIFGICWTVYYFILVGAIFDAVFDSYPSYYY